MGLVENKLQPLFPNIGIYQKDIQSCMCYTHLGTAQGLINFSIVYFSLVLLVLRFIFFLSYLKYLIVIGELLHLVFRCFWKKRHWGSTVGNQCFLFSCPCILSIICINKLNVISTQINISCSCIVYLVQRGTKYIQPVIVTEYHHFSVKKSHLLCIDLLL